LKSRNNSLVVISILNTNIYNY